MADRSKKKLNKKVFGSKERPRLCVYKSLRSIYAQVIDDVASVTYVAACVQGKKNLAAGKELAEKIFDGMKNKGIEKVCFDRNGRKYHGVLKVFADQLREKGIKL